MNRRIFFDLIAPPIFIGGVFAACSSSPSQDEGQKHVAADAAYTADLLVCVDKGKYPTRLESDFCVTQTKKRWGRQ